MGNKSVFFNFTTMTDDTQGLEGKLLENGRFRFDKIFNFDATTEEVPDFIVSIINRLD